MGFLIINGELVHTSALWPSEYRISDDHGPMQPMDPETMYSYRAPPMPYTTAELYPSNAGQALAETPQPRGPRWYLINPEYLKSMGRFMPSPRNRKIGRVRRVHGGRLSRRRVGMRGVPVRRYTTIVGEYDTDVNFPVRRRHAIVRPSR